MKFRARAQLRPLNKFPVPHKPTISPLGLTFCCSIIDSPSLCRGGFLLGSTPHYVFVDLRCFKFLPLASLFSKELCAGQASSASCQWRSRPNAQTLGLGREPSPQEDLSEPLQLVDHQPVCSCGRIGTACAPCVSVRTSDFVSIRALLFRYTLGVTLSERCGYTQTYSTGFWCVL